MFIKNALRPVYQKTSQFFSSTVRKSRPGLGLLCIEGDWQLQTGDIKHKDTFDYPVVQRTIKGLTFEMCMKGEMSSDVEEDFCRAVHEMNMQKEVTGISGDCGFMMHFQRLARQMTTKPVFMSPLVQLPLLSLTHSPRDQFIIMTANGS